MTTLPGLDPHARAEAFASLQDVTRIFDATWDAVPDAMIVCDTDGRMTRTNAALRALFGVAPGSDFFDHTLGERMRVVQSQRVDGTPLAPEDWPVARILHGDQLRGEPADDLWMTSLDGRRMRLSASGSALRDAEGRSLGALIIYRDVTAQRELEAQRQESEARFRRLADTVPALVWMADAAHRCVYVNERWRAFTGRPLDATLGAGWLDDLHPDDRPALHAALHAALRASMSAAVGAAAAAEGGDSPASVEARLRRRDGEYRWMLFQGVTQRGADGEVSGYIASCVDITERKLAEIEREASLARERASHQAAEAERLRLATVLDVLPAGVAIYDAQGRLVQQNASAVQITGRVNVSTEGAPRRQARYAMRGPDGKPLLESQSPSGRARRGEVYTDMQCVISGADGEDTWLLTSGAPLRDEAGALAGAVVVFQDVTAQRALEREVKAQRDRAEVMIENTPFGVALFDATDAFRCLRQNPPFLTLVGSELRARGSIVGLALRELFDAASGEQVAAIFQQARATRQAISIEEFPAVLAPDPETRWYKWSVSPLLDERGAVETLLVSAVEISEQARAREALGREAARLQTILQVLPLGVAISDAEGRMIEFNPALYAIWGDGLPMVERLEQFSAYQGWRPDTGERLAPEEWAMARALRGETVIGQEVVVEMRDQEGAPGGRKTLLNSAAPIYDERGRLWGGVAVVVDISERQRLERRTQATLDALLRMARSAVGASGSQALAARDIAEVTREALGCGRVAVTVIDAETLLIKPLVVVGLSAEEEALWWRMQPEGARYGDDADPAMLARFEAGETLILDMTAPPFDQAPNPFGVTIAVHTPMIQDGRLVGFISLDYNGVRHTMTPEELKLVGGVADLAALIIERERLQTATAAAQARELALRATNERMRTFLGIAGHELRTPVTTIKSSVQLATRAAERALDVGLPSAIAARMERSLKLLDGANRQADKLNRFIADLLDVTRIQAGSLEMRMGDVEVGAIVGEAVETLRVDWPGRAILMQAPDAPLWARGDADRLGQVVNNLLTNALKYSPDEQPVEVALAREGESARVSVCDHGPGLPPEQLARLFQAFERIEGVKQQSGASIGLGLGLFICRTIVEAHGGQIGVESAPDAGATFWFTLPLISAPPALAP